MNIFFPPLDVPILMRTGNVSREFQSTQGNKFRKEIMLGHPAFRHREVEIVSQVGAKGI